ncbi:hypothetical protein JCM30760_21770 [Thiomicrorhabdus hydrogeniphila]
MATELNIQLPIQQSQQANGFWLVSLSLQDNLGLANAIGSAFYLEQAPDIKLVLFQYASDNLANHYQFLSLQELPKTLFTRPGKLLCNSNLAFNIPFKNQPLLILANDLAMANAFALAKHSTNQQSSQRANHKESEPTIVGLHSQTAFPFVLKPARYLMPNMPAEAIGACTLLEDWKIQNRLSSSMGLPGCFEGELPDLFEYWAKSMHKSSSNLEQIPWQIILFTDDIDTQKKCLQISQSYNWLTLQAYLI